MEKDLEYIYEILKKCKIIGSGNLTKRNYGGSRAYTMPCGIKWNYIDTKYDTHLQPLHLNLVGLLHIKQLLFLLWSITPI